MIGVITILILYFLSQIPKIVNTFIEICTVFQKIYLSMITDNQYQYLEKCKEFSNHNLKISTVIRIYPEITPGQTYSWLLFCAIHGIVFTAASVLNFVSIYINRRCM